MRRQVTQIHLWQIVLPYFFLGLAFLLAGVVYATGEHNRRVDANAEGKRRADAICESENHTRAAIRGFIAQEIVIPANATPEQRARYTAFIDDTQRVFADVDCPTLVNHPPKS